MCRSSELSQRFQFRSLVTGSPRARHFYLKTVGFQRTAKLWTSANNSLQSPPSPPQHQTEDVQSGHPADIAVWSGDLEGVQETDAKAQSFPPQQDRIPDTDILERMDIFVPTAAPGLHQLLSPRPSVKFCLVPHADNSNIERTPESPLPASSSASIASPSAAAASVSTTSAHIPNLPRNINRHAVNTNDMDSVDTCPHCGRNFTSHIGLVGHLRIRPTETGEPVPGAPTYTRRCRLICPCTFTHCMGLFGRRRIHESGIDGSPDTPNTSRPSPMSSST
nr:unnamed protein product [Spirometra erinaceieuropaei]